MKKIYWLLVFALLSPLLQRPVAAQEVLSVQLVVNSDRDGAIVPDNFLTLREAIEIVNGTLPQNKLSTAEKNLVKPLEAGTPRIEFNLPSQQTTIRLDSILPPIIHPVVIDGTTQSGYQSKSSNVKEPLSINQLSLPVVALTPEENIEIFRGLTIAANDVTVRSVNLGILKPGERVSAIATQVQYGTSEPALNTEIRTID